MAEHLDDLLPVHHFLNKAVDGAEVALLRHKVFAGIAGQVLGRQQHNADHNQRYQRQQRAEHNHRNQHADDHNAAVEQLRDALADHLAQGVGIVGVDGHNVAVGVAVKILDGQRLHMGEQIVAQTLQRALGDVCHNARLREVGDDAADVEGGGASDGSRQTGEIAALLCQQGQNVVVDELLHKQRALHGSQHADNNADAYRHHSGGVGFADIAHNAHKDLAGVFDLGAGSAGAAGTDFNHLCFFCHYASPPFSSKSPEPWVWLLYTS